MKKNLRKIVDIGFMPGRGIVDVVFILRRLTEKYWSKGKKMLLYYIYIYIYIYIFYIYYIYIYIYIYIPHGITMKMPYRLDILLHRPASHPIFSYFLHDQ